MKAGFRTSLFGFDKKQVNEYIARLSAEHENALALKSEIRDQNNILRNELARYRAMEQEISSVLITARATANGIIKEGEQSAMAEKERLKEEVHGLDGLAHTLYAQLENTIQQAEDIARGFEQELTGLKLRKEAFLKSSYPFESGKDKEEGEAFRLSISR